MIQLDVLRGSAFGSRTAEDERDSLAKYFVETEQWRRVFVGDIDVIYGAKGSGKSAIYSLIIDSRDGLFDRSIIAVPAENPQGAPAFRDISADPPEGEREFINLWKIYIASLCGQYIKEYGISNEKTNKALKLLEGADLIPSQFSLAKLLKYAFDYIKSMRAPKSLEGEYKFDPNTGMPTGISGKITLSEPSAQHARHGVVSIDDLLELINSGLSEAGYTLWIMLDRLDVAFSDKPDLEADALKALFKCYLEMGKLSHVVVKIFLRTDIWKNITENGSREASHIERSITLSWNQDDLLNLVVKRAVSNEKICEYFNVEKEDIISSFDNQKKFIDRMFPLQVETGVNKPTTFNWLLGRTRDAFEEAAPREVIHFLNELRSVQIARYERGVKPPTDGKLFEQPSFKEALPAVSKTRLEQTLYAEFPNCKGRIEALREQKATQTPENLCKIWRVDENEMMKIAASLEEIGFFKRSTTLGNTVWVIPFLYREALQLVQGTA